MYLSDLVLSAWKCAYALGCVALLTALIGLGLFSIKKRFPNSGFKISEAMGAAFVFGVLAIVTGIIMSASRSSAVGNVLPVALTFIGGITLYLITKEKSEAVTVSSAVVSFSVLLLFGSVLGSYERNRAIDGAEIAKFDLDRLRWQAQTEFAINGFRDAYGLEPISVDLNTKK